MAAARRVGVGELVDEQQRRVPRERGVEVEFFEQGAAVLDPSARQDLYAVEQRLGFRAVVGLDDAGDDVDAGGALGARGLEHRVGLADAGGGAEEDLQLAPRPPRLFITHVREEGIGIGPPLGHAGAECTPLCGTAAWCHWSRAAAVLARDRSGRD